MNAKLTVSKTSVKLYVKLSAKRFIFATVFFLHLTLFPLANKSICVCFKLVETIWLFQERLSEAEKRNDSAEGYNWSGLLRLQDRSSHCFSAKEAEREHEKEYSCFFPFYDNKNLWTLANDGKRPLPIILAFRRYCVRFYHSVRQPFFETAVHYRVICAYAVRIFCP